MPNPVNSVAVLVGLGPVPTGSEVPVGLDPILGRSPFQRHLYHLSRLGFERVVVVSDGADPVDAAVAGECRRQQAELGTSLDIEVCARDASVQDAVGPAAAPSEAVLVVSGAAIFDPRLYAVVAEAAEPAWIVDQVVPIGLARLIRSQLDDLEPADGRVIDVGQLPAYLPDQRRTLRPYWTPITNAEDQARAADFLIGATQKGVLDFPARYLHPIPEDRLTRWLAPTPITPNQITVLTGVLGFAATYLFATGAFGPALALALLVNVLDGVDGKLARVKLLTSRFGDRLDHVLDVTFEFSWYLGLGWGLMSLTGERWPLVAGFALIAIMLGCRAVSGIYKALSGRQIHDHTAFDRAVRLVAGRRNIYVLILVAGWAVGSLGGAFRVTLGWGAATLAVYVARTIMAAAGRWAGRRYRWGTER